ncbi:adenine deaminase [endosymbiont 'TC1' of Trimyema compressum]|nr:adenine deaminase [endosymbiont 'TC1' of Trimyema compressum]
MGRIKCDLVLKNGHIINVFTNEIINGNLGILEGIIIGIGDYEGKEEIDLKGKYVSPSFIDAHVHIESSMVAPPLFAKNIIPRGTTTVIADPHEIANVSGLAGISYILDSTEETPLDVYVMLPSCVPATPFETSGAILKAKDLKKLINHPRVKGLGELMDYVGVVNGSQDIIDKLEIAKDKIVDGHGPNLFGKELNVYAVSGVKTDHECTTPEEMLEQLRAGFYIQMRQGTVTKDVENLLSALNKDNLRRCLFCSDDKHPEKISERGHINENINIAIKGGVEPIDAIKMASLNAAECYGLKGKGAIAPGYIADLIVFDSLTNIKPSLVFKNGKLVAEDSKPLFRVAGDVGSEKIISKVNIKEITKRDIALYLKGNKVNVIKILPDSVVTKKVIREVKIENGVFIKDPNVDICKIVIIERHSGKSTLFTALIEGFGIENGAISSTVAHDSHNLIIIGDNDEDILNCIRRTKEIDGGITISSGGKIIGEISLKIAGLMSTEDLEVVSAKMNELTALTKPLKINERVDPFMTLAFMALPVIPEIKITDKGLFDVNLFEFITVDAE